MTSLACGGFQGCTPRPLHRFEAYSAMHPADVHQLVVAMDRAAARFTGSDTVARDPETVLREIVAGAVDAVPGATHAGITTLHPDGRISSTTPPVELVARLDQAQAAMREGPCVRAAGTGGHPRRPVPGGDRDADGDDPDGEGEPTGGSMVHVGDLTTDTDHWPRFAAEAVRNGVLSMLSFQLSGTRSPRTALNLYADHAQAFDLSARTTAALFADQAAIALHGADHAASLNRALDSRDVIGQAKGILRERHHIDAEQAFAMLVEASQQANLELRDVADWLLNDLVRGDQELDSGG